MPTVQVPVSRGSHDLVILPRILDVSMDGTVGRDDHPSRMSESVNSTTSHTKHSQTKGPSVSPFDLDRHSEDHKLHNPVDFQLVKRVAQEDRRRDAEEVEANEAGFSHSESDSERVFSRERAPSPQEFSGTSDSDIESVAPEETERTTMTFLSKVLHECEYILAQCEDTSDKCLKSQQKCRTFQQECAVSQRRCVTSQRTGEKSMEACRRSLADCGQLFDHLDDTRRSCTRSQEECDKILTECTTLHTNCEAIISHVLGLLQESVDSPLLKRETVGHEIGGGRDVSGREESGSEGSDSEKSERERSGSEAPSSRDGMDDMTATSRHRRQHDAPSGPRKHSGQHRSFTSTSRSSSVRSDDQSVTSSDQRGRPLAKAVAAPTTTRIRQRLRQPGGGRSSTLRRSTMH